MAFGSRNDAYSAAVSASSFLSPPPPLPLLLVAAADDLARVRVVQGGVDAPGTLEPRRGAAGPVASCVVGWGVHSQQPIEESPPGGEGESVYFTTRWREFMY